MTDKVYACYETYVYWQYQYIPVSIPVWIYPVAIDFVMYSRHLYIPQIMFCLDSGLFILEEYPSNMVSVHHRQISYLFLTEDTITYIQSTWHITPKLCTFYLIYEI